MSTQEITPGWLIECRQACQRLGDFVLHQARSTAHEQGFGWTARPDAPDTYDLLQVAHRRSARTGEPLPVSSLFCDSAIYLTPSINHAMRFWHDTMHVGTKLTFSLDDELELGLKHLDIAAKNGLRKGSMEYEVLRIDLLGQNYLLGIAQRFPIDQRAFIQGCLLNGLDEGVLMEARQLPIAA